MANLLWGNVYYKSHFAGFLREEPGERTSFTYDESYLNAGHPPIAHTLPLQSEPHISQSGLHPFFDNLVAEGWLENAQMRLLGKRIASHFELLLAFGEDCAGAVSIIDPEPVSFKKHLADITDPKDLAVMAIRASLSGIQPKLTLIQRDKKFHIAKAGELSTYIAKFPSHHHDDLVINEYLTMLAFKALLPEDDVVDFHLGTIEGLPEIALIIKRFDRNHAGDRIHFEEFNQLLGQPSRFKYNGAYKDMASFIQNTKDCLIAEIYRLYLRILAGFLLGNTDMHLKNFAMLHTKEGLRLAPSYDQVSSIIYNYKTLALAIGNAENLDLSTLKPSNIIKLADEFHLPRPAIKMALDHLTKNLNASMQVITDSEIGPAKFKNQLINQIKKRWNGTFVLIGKSLSKKP
ncbi:MAG: hypothetical protein C5B43_02110 [Verrucomicrobia bacterium]|nr:MAG: hypothetical protein C5B43_02110 [Verrucomicrobiota bacterium]